MSPYIYIAVMAVTTYLIRMIPLVFFRKEIKNRFIRSFLAYVPCACLTAMTFPAILTSTNAVISGTVALAVALVAVQTQSGHRCGAQLCRGVCNRVDNTDYVRAYNYA